MSGPSAVGKLFSNTELDMYEYILTKKMDWKFGDKIKWNDMEYHWVRVAATATINDRHASIYIRTATQLKEKWKTSLKQQYEKSRI